TSINLNAFGNGGVSGLTISNNTLDTSPAEGIVAFGVSSSSITGNFSNGSVAAVDLAGGNSGISIDNNALLNGTWGILVEDPVVVGPNSSIDANFNCIAGN